MRSSLLRDEPLPHPDAIAAQMRMPGSFALLVTIATAAVLVLPGIAPAHASHQIVAATGGYDPGTIVIHTRERRLYYYLADGTAVRYPVGVGRAGKQWSGTAYINGKYRNPDWKPPDVIRRDKPHLPSVIPGGSPKNPMGVAAMTLSGGEYAIHGTNRPSSIGGFVSYGCIRMYNEDVTDLYDRVDYNTRVVVME